MKVDRIFQNIVKTNYGRIIKGGSRGYDYGVYISESKDQKNIEHKLYYVSRNGNWVKSFLKFYSDNKQYKAITSKAKDLKDVDSKK